MPSPMSFLSVSPSPSSSLKVDSSSPDPSSKGSLAPIFAQLESKNPTSLKLSTNSNRGDQPTVNLAIAIGVVAAIGLFSVLLIFVCACCCAKKKKKRPHDSMKYYADTSFRDSDFYSAAPPKWHNGDHAVKLGRRNDDMSVGFTETHGPKPLPPPSPIVALAFDSSTFTYEELVAATGGFSPSNLLGQGGFGYVHKGVLPNGREIAVKQLKSGSGQGEREFHAEVDIISRVHHLHLVSLVGYCISGAQRMLVYEFVPNKTLEYHLHGKGLPVMDWSRRLKIALGSARGLAYLHEDCE